MSGAKIAQMSTIPQSTSPVMSMPRCRPTDWRRWETMGSRENHDFFAFSSSTTAGTPEPGAASAKSWVGVSVFSDISTSLGGR